MRLKAASDWSTQKTFYEKIPQNIYPLSLNSGDNIEAILSWLNNEYNDLDIYLFNSTQDLLGSRGIAKEVNGKSTNPEILKYTVSSSGDYYLRAHLYSRDVTIYKIEVKINSVSVESFD